MKPVSVVENLDELEDCSANLNFGRPRLAVDELFFERREPALPDGVVPALALSSKGSGSRRSWRAACGRPYLKEVLVPGYWTISLYEGYANPNAVGPGGIGVYLALAGEALVVLTGVFSLVREPTEPPAACETGLHDLPRSRSAPSGISNARESGFAE